MEALRLVVSGKSSREEKPDRPSRPEPPPAPPEDAPAPQHAEEPDRPDRSPPDPGPPEAPSPPPKPEPPRAASASATVPWYDDPRLQKGLLRTLPGWGTFLVGAPLVWALARVGFADYPQIGRIQGAQLGLALFAALIGFLGGFGAILVLWLLNRFRAVAVALIALFLLYLVLLPFFGAGMGYAVGVFSALAGFALAWALLFKLPDFFKRPTTFGSAEWADYAHIEAHGLTGPRGFWLGEFPRPARKNQPVPPPALLRYGGDRHLLTIAPTRAGKGVSAIIPNLLTYGGSALVIDPKGENALITAAARTRMGHQVHVLDPWGIATPRLPKAVAATFNPLDWLQPDSPDIGEDAMLLADALVVPSPGEDNPFWTEEAKALLQGLILHVATDPDEAANRHLGRVRDLLMLTTREFNELLTRMLKSPHGIVRSTGARTAGKEPKLLSNVLSATQSHTHFLDSPRMRESLATSSFTFADLKEKKTTVYLVLPADRLNAFGRWLRLLIQHALTVNSRNIALRPEQPILFMLDEMAALGRLTMVEQAYGLMAGFGVQLWGIVQDASQLKRIYGDGWETFVSNSGVLQYFGSRDQMTAEYFSNLCGMTTMVNISQAIADAVSSQFGSGDRSSTRTTTTTQANSQRKLAYADELMTLRSDKQLLLIENMNPLSAFKSKWYEHPDLKNLGTNLHKSNS